MQIVSCTFGLGIIAFLILCPAAGAQGSGDVGIPDSAYYLEPTFRHDGCTGGVRALIPLYLFSDAGEFFRVEFTVDWLGDACLQNIEFTWPWLKESTTTWYEADCSERHAYIIIQDYHNLVETGSGVLCVLDFSSSSGDSLALSTPWEDFLFMHFIDDWRPTFQNLDTTIVFPEMPPVDPGDADASGLVDIDDVVYLLNYIFSGGCPPWDLNSGDVDASCGIDIDDVVYLIEFIFGGGPAPLQGCVR